MLRIEITPWFHRGSPDIELRIRVTTRKGVLSYDKIIPHDEFVSWWERIMDEAKALIKEHYLNEVLGEKNERV